MQLSCTPFEANNKRSQEGRKEPVGKSEEVVIVVSSIDNIDR